MLVFFCFCLFLFCLFLPSANEVWGKVIFSEAYVKNTVHGGGGVALVRGVHGCGGHAWLGEGAQCVVVGGWACMVAGGHAWLWGACVVSRGVGEACVGYDKIRSMSRRYASYWNAFLFLI